MLESCPSEVLLVGVGTGQGERGLQSHLEGSAGRGTAVRRGTSGKL